FCLWLGCWCVVVWCLCLVFVFVWCWFWCWCCGGLWVLVGEGWLGFFCCGAWWWVCVWCLSVVCFGGRVAVLSLVLFCWCFLVCCCLCFLFVLVGAGFVGLWGVFCVRLGWVVFQSAPHPGLPWLNFSSPPRVWCAP
ncbi:hypothetical protein, partial [Pseudomonas syringae group genomosp. 7]|uniref:hypothetical protein n=1 Tax=Pseudomonas syringae group genomosp. 7 TaxID=251699 RepID=UPI0037705B1E